MGGIDKELYIHVNRCNSVKERTLSENPQTFAAETRLAGGLTFVRW
jgi:hypothetical protein